MQNQDLKLNAVARKSGQNFDKHIKGVLYGKEIDSQPIAADSLAVERLFDEASYNRVFDIDIDGKSTKVMFKDIQKDPVSNNIRHFDLHAISMKDKMVADVPVHFEGESEIVNMGEATLATISDTVEVEALPLDLPEHFTVDISGLKEIGDQITVADLKKQPGAEILDDPEKVIVKLNEIVEEEEPEPEEGEGEEGKEGVESEGDESAEDGESEGEASSDDKSEESTDEKSE